MAWVKDAGIYCAPSDQRLKDIEALGESEEAWKVREFILSNELHDLDSPSDESGYGVDFEEWRTTLSEVSKRYSTTQRPKLVTWVQEAVKHVESQRNKLSEGAGGRSVAEQNKIIDEEVAFLNGLVKNTSHDSLSVGQLQITSSPAALNP